MKNEREIAEKMIADAETMAKEGRTKLDALDGLKSELKHLDYGYAFGNKGDFRFFVREGSGKFIAYGESGCVMNDDVFNTSCWQNKRYTITGNLKDIFADLKRNSEDLKDFNLDVHRYYFNFTNLSHAPIHIAGNWHTMDEAIKFHQDFGQLLAYAKRQKAKGK